MKPSSAKQKGRLLQQRVRDMLLENAPELTDQDIRSTSMGASGEDVTMSTAARKVYPFQIECKSKAAYSVYTDYTQAAAHGTHEPVLVIKANHKKPLVVVDAEWFFKNFRKDKE